MARATVELRDLRGMKMAVGFTDSAGKFAIATTAMPGEYVLLVAKELQIGDERITLDQSDREVTIAFPVAPSTVAAPSQPMYTVSAQELRVPAKARAHLKLAHHEFSRFNFSGAEREINQALQVDSMCAAAFSMRPLLRLASRDPSRAIEDATRALALDSDEADAYVALATAYNSLKEFQRAETAAQQALSSRPDFWQARLEMAKALYGEDRFVLALRELDELNNDFPDVHLVRANILQRLDRSGEAAEHHLLVAFPASLIAGALLATLGKAPSYLGVVRLVLTAGFGILVAFAGRAPSWLLVALSAVLGISVGWANATEAFGQVNRFRFIAGLAVVGLLLLVYGNGLVRNLKREWTQIAVRVVGSWIAAVSILVLGL